MKKILVLAAICFSIIAIGYLGAFLLDSPAKSDAANTASVQTDAIRESKPQNGVYTITIKDGKVDQPNISIKQGKTIRWVNADTVPHTLVDSGDSDAPGPNSGIIEPGQSYSFTFNTASEFGYRDPSYPDLGGLVYVYISEYN